MGRRQLVNQSRKETDAETILKHIEDTDSAFGYVATCRKPGNAVHCAGYFPKGCRFFVVIFEKSLSMRSAMAFSGKLVIFVFGSQTSVRLY